MFDEIIELILVAVITTAFYIQGQAYKPLIKGVGVQSFVLGVLSLFLGFENRNIDYFILGLIVILLRAYIVPKVLLRTIKTYEERERISGVASLLAIDLAFFFIAVLIIYEIVLVKVIPSASEYLIFAKTLVLGLLRSN